MALNPSIGLAQPDQLALRVQELERRMDRLAAANPLSRSSATDAAGKIRLRTGYLTQGNDAAGFGVEIFDAAGVSVFRADETGIASGGQVRAIDVATSKSDVLNFASLTTTEATVLTVTLVKPTWATVALVRATASVQATNSSGGGQNIYGGARINGLAGYRTNETSNPNGSTASVSSTNSETLTGLTGNVTVDLRAGVTAATNAGNFCRLVADVIWLR
jgi:hypothetical protein